MKDNTALFLITFGVLLLVCLFNVYMNLYNDDRIKTLEERVYAMDTITQTPEPQKHDTIIVLHKFENKKIAILWQKVHIQN